MNFFRCHLPNARQDESAALVQERSGFTNDAVSSAPPSSRRKPALNTMVSKSRRRLGPGKVEVARCQSRIGRRSSGDARLAESQARAREGWSLDQCRTSLRQSRHGALREPPLEWVAPHEVGAQGKTFPFNFQYDKSPRWVT